MNETAARDVVLVSAIETADKAREAWSDADRAWASRAAAEVVGAHAPPEVFLARRAALAVERLSSRFPAIPRLLRAVTWRSWVGIAVILAAFVVGVAADQIGGTRRINILAPPLLALLVWNLAVFLALAVNLVGRIFTGGSRALGPLRRFLARLGYHTPRRLSQLTHSGVLAPAIAAFLSDWTRLSAPLLTARVSRVLHLAAAVFALGAIAGLYVRGLALEYRGGWESTFLNADAVHRLLSFALAPGAAVTGIPIPSAASLEALRLSAAGENAAPWIHLYAATVILVVIVPRLLLAAYAWWSERRKSRNFPLRLDSPYHQRLLRGFVEGPARVHVVPYSYEVPPESIAGLKAVVARVYGRETEVTLAAPVRYGEEDALPADRLPSATVHLLIALFNAAATPEKESHGAFVATLRAGIVGETRLAALIDEASFRQRFPGQSGRLEERSAAWRQMLEAQGLAPVFLDLSAPDLASAEAALDSAIQAVRA